MRCISFASPFVPLTGQGSPTASNHRYPLDDEPAGSEPEHSDAPAAEPPASAVNDLDGTDNDDDDDGFGDFDDFEEGGEADDDFGDFDDGFQGEDEGETTIEEPPSLSVPTPPPGPVSQNNSILCIAFALEPHDVIRLAHSCLRPNPPPRGNIDNADERANSPY